MVEPGLHSGDKGFRADHRPSHDFRTVGGVGSEPAKEWPSVEIMRISEDIKDFESRVEENDRYHEELHLLAVEGSHGEEKSEGKPKSKR